MACLPDLYLADHIPPRDCQTSVCRVEDLIGEEVHSVYPLEKVEVHLVDFVFFAHPLDFRRIFIPWREYFADRRIS